MIDGPGAKVVLLLAANWKSSNGYSASDAAGRESRCGSVLDSLKTKMNCGAKTVLMSPRPSIAVPSPYSKKPW